MISLSRSESVRFRKSRSRPESLRVGFRQSRPESKSPPTDCRESPVVVARQHLWQVSACLANNIMLIVFSNPINLHASTCMTLKTIVLNITSFLVWSCTISACLFSEIALTKCTRKRIYQSHSGRMRQRQKETAE